MFEISVDIGGTFTDVVVSDSGGRFVIGKALTTPERAFDGLREALSAAAANLATTADALLRASSRLTYGTTRATNAIVTRQTAKTALLITEGFPDVLLLREGGKADPHDYTISYPDPYVAKALTFEIPGRISAEGGVERPFKDEAVVETLRRLKAANVEAVGVCLFWSIVNPEHELRLADLLEKHLPGVPFTLSHQVLPIVREYRRALASVLDASLKPLMQRHLRDLDSDLRAAGFAGDLLVSTTIGGNLDFTRATERPVHMVKSGPAMAPVAAWNYASRETDRSDVIVCDTGGTTFDVGLIRDKEIVRTRETWLGPKYLGELLAISSVDIRSVGAGGGSIARVDEGGLLLVGPESAGSEPGPACYGRGGVEPTVTDAAVVAGYVDPNFFLGGKMKLELDGAAAFKAVGRVADALGLPVEQAASAILTVANERMISAIQDITISEGIDPRESAVVAGGGAAGLNMVSIAKELGCKEIIFPRTASALSACGMQYSDTIYEATVSAYTSSDSFDFAAVASAHARLSDDIARFKSGLSIGEVAEQCIEYSVEARYRSQIWELEVSYADSSIETDAHVLHLANAFHALHERTFAVKDVESAIEFLTWKARLRLSPLRERGAALLRTGKQENAAPARTQQAFFSGRGMMTTSFYEGTTLCAGMTVVGPAIIVEPTTTIVIPPDAVARVSDQSNYIISTGA
jgi:N-methylhydantoinase A